MLEQDKSVVRSAADSDVPMVEGSLPEWRSICFWDFGWLAFRGKSGPFANLARAVEDTVRQGYNLIRLDAIPLAAFREDGAPRTRVEFAPWPDNRADGIRWYDYAEPAVVNPMDDLCEVLRIARDNDCQVILSSWEYQQTLSLLSDSALADAALAVPHQGRFMHLAKAWAHVVDHIAKQGLLDVVAYVELHNELNASMFSDLPFPYRPAQMKQHVEEALAYLQERFPNVAFTACYTEIGPHQLADLPDNIQIMHQHIYDWTLVEELEGIAGIRDNSYPNDFSRAMLRPGTVSYQDYLWKPEDAWRSRANDAARMDWFHLHHAGDPAKFDAWVEAAWPRFERAILERIKNRLQAYSLEARRRQIPAYIGEGWIGWWPARSRFELSEQAKGVIVQAVRWARELGFSGAILSSNFAPHHREWQQAEWQADVNAQLKAGLLA